MIKNNLSELLGKRRMKMSELADMTGLNRNTVLNLYHDRSTRIEFQVLDKICVALDIQPGDLLERVPDEES